MTTLTARLELASSKAAARVPGSATAVPKHTGPSNVALFITNLKLLDLDCKEDWPGITTATFSIKNTQQNQKSRVQCVEWALFQLLAIWDPAETKEVSLTACLLYLFSYTDICCRNCDLSTLLSNRYNLSICAPRCLDASIKQKRMGCWAEMPCSVRQCWMSVRVIAWRKCLRFSRPSS